MALVSGSMEMRRHALEICESSRIGRSAKSFFILEARSPQTVMRHVAMPEPTLARKRDPEL
jgi:hypothetical protein